jgi:hypothetical protein
MVILKFILKIPVKILLTILYPLIKLFLLNQLDQLSGERNPTGFFEGIVNLWKW